VARLLPFALLLLLGAQIALSTLLSSESGGWRGVPPAPSEAGARLAALGDAEFFYRAAALGLQMSGEAGAGSTHFESYDYHRLAAWFRLEDRLSPGAESMPALAAYYYSWTPVDSDLGIVIGYLADRAEADPARDWRWLVQAIYLARHRKNDLPLALSLAERLAALGDKVVELPSWALQMRAFALDDLGDREAARGVLESLLASDTDIPPEERRFMQRYLDTRLKQN
jgi:hypothetical protein